MNSRSILDDKIKEQVAQVANHDFVREILDANLNKYYPDFQKIEELTLKAYKKHIGKTSAVFVIGYKIKYLNTDNKIGKLELFATAHSDDSRKAAFEKLNFLYQNGFNQGKFQVTRPLFFLSEQKGFFYESSVGRSLFSFFKEDSFVDLGNALDLAAGWVRELHSLKDKSTFSWPKFSVSNMIPSPQQFLPDFIEHDQLLGSKIKRIVSQIQNWEKELKKTFQETLIYGDYHPENIIITDLQAQNLKMIDFTDVALGDPMTDLGTFLQQFDFMGHRFFSREKINQDKEYFFNSYFQKSLSEVEENYFQRINLYQAWTALRTAVFLFYMHRDDSVKELLREVESYILLIDNKEKRINIH
ncbi:phosphotransferase [Candidatus Nomurabacteria bacterium]|nr:phosphotransferase [Candidatus Nomurabacteria bacterium]